MRGFGVDSGDGFGLDEVRLGFSVLTLVHGVGSFFDVSGVGGKPMAACCTRLPYPVACRRLWIYMVYVRKCRTGKLITVWPSGRAM